MPLRHLETTLHPLLQNRFLRRPEGRLGILSSIRLHIHHLSDFVQVVFFNVQEAQNEYAWPFDTMQHRFVDSPKSFLKTRIMSSQGHSRT
jgi:hypothetical protein